MRYIKTEADFRRTVVIGATTESYYLDFKRDLDRWRVPHANVRREAQKELCRDVSQFANTFGGCLLIGVDENRIGDAKVASAIVGVDDFDGRREWMEQAMQNFLLPAAFGVIIERIVIGDQTIIGVNVPPSEHLVKLWDREPGVVQAVRRTNHGKQVMHPNEMETHVMNSKRSAQIAFERVQAELPGVTDVDLASGIWTGVRRTFTDPPSIERVPGARATLGDTGEHEFELRITSKLTPQNLQGALTIRVPYGLLRETWATSNRQFGMFLHVRIIQQGAVLSLEPF